MNDLKIFAKTIEPEAVSQVEALMGQPTFAGEKVRIMPDAHYGAGCVIGFTSTIGDYVIANIVGVDIGCGVRVDPIGAIKFDGAELDATIKQYVPSGTNTHEESDDIGIVEQLRCRARLKSIPRIHKSVGTLGGGNHFIEVDVDEDGCYYLVIHSGSRNLGKQVAEHYQSLAANQVGAEGEIKREIARAIESLKLSGNTHLIQSTIQKIKSSETRSAIPCGLEYLSGSDMYDYLHDMSLCQEYAIQNRRKISSIITDKMGWAISDDAFESVHNYIDTRQGIIRKGAIDATKGKRVIIPINMRDGCIIGIGKGNPDWNYSAPHGAGRIMSRSKAFKTLKLNDFQDAMDGIYTTTATEKTLDEAPMVYKPMDEILETIGDTVEVERIIKSMYNFKASE